MRVVTPATRARIVALLDRIEALVVPIVTDDSAAPELAASATLNTVLALCAEIKREIDAP